MTLLLKFACPSLIKPIIEVPVSYLLGMRRKCWCRIASAWPGRHNHIFYWASLQDNNATCNIIQLYDAAITAMPDSFTVIIMASIMLL